MKNKKYSLGVDINEHSISVVELQQNRSGLVISAHETQQDLDYKKDIKVFSRALKNIIVKNNIQSKCAYIAIPSQQVIKKEFLFGSILNALDVELQLNVNQQEYFPGIDDPLVFDFMFAGQAKDQNNSKNAIIFAAKKQEVMRRIKILNAAGLSPVCIEPDGYALLRTAIIAKEFKTLENKVGIFLCTNKYTGRVIIFNQHEILYEHGIAGFQCQEELDYLQVLEKALQTFRLSYPKYQLGEIYIANVDDESNVSKKQLENKFNLLVVDFNPLQKLLDIKLKESDGLLLMALGLALRKFYARD
jgi:Tfp pilus assembly PilM family ATPase